MINRDNKIQAIRATMARQAIYPPRVEMWTRCRGYYQHFDTGKVINETEYRQKVNSGILVILVEDCITGEVA
jgi:hypothetical protein